MFSLCVTMDYSERRQGHHPGTQATDAAAAAFSIAMKSAAHPAVALWWQQYMTHRAISISSCEHTQACCAQRGAGLTDDDSRTAKAARQSRRLSTACYNYALLNVPVQCV